MDKIWFAAQRAVRTAAQVVVTGALILAGVVVVAPQVLDAIADVLPGPVVAWLAGVLAVLASISAALSRVMAIPAVNAWLTKLGLGTAPRGAQVVHRGGFDGPEGMTRRQYRKYLEEQ